MSSHLAIAQGSSQPIPSSIPWVLIGARRHSSIERSDGVLARGGTAGVELVGFVRESEVRGQALEGALGGLLGRRTGFSSVSSQSVPPVFAAPDQRPSTYTLAWQGRAPASADLSASFDRALPEILAAADRGLEEEIEWAIAPILFLLHSYEADISRRRRSRTTLIGLYALVFTVGVLAFILVGA